MIGSFPKGKSYRRLPANAALSFEQQCEAADQLFKAAPPPTEVKESKASEADAFTKELAPIHAGIEGWKASLSKLSFPCVITARIEMTPPAGDKINVPLVKSIAYYFENSEGATHVLNAHYNLIKTTLEKDRQEHAKDLQNFGTKSIGYIIPQCKTEMTFVHIAPAEGDKYDITVFTREVTAEALGCEQTAMIPGSELIDGMDTLEEVYGIKGNKSKVVEAMAKLRENQQ